MAVYKNQRKAFDAAIVAPNIRDDLHPIDDQAPAFRAQFCRGSWRWLQRPAASNRVCKGRLVVTWLMPGGQPRSPAEAGTRGGRDDVLARMVDGRRRLDHLRRARFAKGTHNTRNAPKGRCRPARADHSAQNRGRLVNPT